MQPPDVDSRAPWRLLGRLFRRGSEQERSERRSETRIPDHGQVALRWLDDRGDRDPIVACLVDSSSAGVRIRCRAPLDQGCEVELEDERGIRSPATVQWVQQDGEDFEAGLGMRFAIATESNGDALASPASAVA